MDPLSTARYGMMMAEARFSASAERVASGDDDVDLVHETIEQIKAKQQFVANVHVVRIADEMWRTLMDVQAK